MDRKKERQKPDKRHEDKNKMRRSVGLSSAEQRRGSRMEETKEPGAVGEETKRQPDTNKNRNSKDPAASLELTHIQLIPHNRQKNLQSHSHSMQQHLHI